ncbi:HigA family addiction module antitoxin [Microvirga puerhi]|uniref:HigA family addiction module antidote protein n=1 Tax=Microvirga puerhi TaxID=2876078 RepID=A0ABS7VVB1_9HYPH|nr:HigA family addiction module antitoxin [Microvirga puerhi]MBZ6078907.1 HigA family addiction module antidote protein [Microvirga puerhi]
MVSKLPGPSPVSYIPSHAELVEYINGRRDGSDGAPIAGTLYTVLPLHPGRILKGIIEDSGLSIARVAHICRIRRATLEQIILERKPITANVALRLSRFLPQTAPVFWMNVQISYDLAVARTSSATESDLDRIVPFCRSRPPHELRSKIEAVAREEA